MDSQLPPPRCGSGALLGPPLQVSFVLSTMSQFWLPQSQGKATPVAIPAPPSLNLANQSVLEQGSPSPLLALPESAPNPPPSASVTPLGGAPPDPEGKIRSSKSEPTGCSGATRQAAPREARRLRVGLCCPPQPHRHQSACSPPWPSLTGEQSRAAVTTTSEFRQPICNSNHLCLKL